MAKVDVYAITDKLDDTLLQVAATRLEARGQNPRFRAMLTEYLDAMRIEAARTVLDLGCGTGVAARAIARRKGFTGRVTGIDLSAGLLRVAERLSTTEGVRDQIEFVLGDTRRLALPDEAFDAVVAHTVVSHVDNPLLALKEAARVVKRGGTIGIFDGDYASITFDHPDAIKGKAYDEALVSAIVTNPRLMRQMPRLLREAGLELVTSYQNVLAEIGRADFWLSALEAFRKQLPKSGAMSEEEAAVWVDGRLADSRNGVFFAACNFYSYVVRRPN
ncbi:MAG: methyltransferase domain-containing protein [Verrucomicrobia bacterium]|nr:methyltransferase domain-containing protein [Verrucomicrobiota bacterium]